MCVCVCVCVCVCERVSLSLCACSRMPLYMHEHALACTRDRKNYTRWNLPPPPPLVIGKITPDGISLSSPSLSLSLDIRISVKSVIMVSLAILFPRLMRHKISEENTRLNTCKFYEDWCVALFDALSLLGCAFCSSCHFRSPAKGGKTEETGIGLITCQYDSSTCYDCVGGFFFLFYVVRSWDYNGDEFFAYVIV